MVKFKKVSITKYFKKLYSHFMHDSLRRNSLFLIASTAVTSVLGFVFWIICTHSYSADQVGIATTLISAITLISTLSLLGFNNALIRYFHKSHTQAARINTTFTLLGFVTLLASLIFVLGLHIFSPKLLFLQHNRWYASFFILTAVLTTISTVLDSTFIAFGKASMTLVKNGSMSVIKMLLPLLFVSFGAIGIFLASTISILVACIIGVILLALKLNHLAKPHFSRSLAREMSRFSMQNYLATLIESITISLLPIIITNRISAATSGYFYIDVMIINALYIIPTSMSQVMFAESSQEESSMFHILKKATRFILTFMVPAIIAVILLGRNILSIFGHAYSAHGYAALVLFCLAGIPVSMKLLANVIFNIEHKIKFVIIINLVTVSIVMGLSYVMLPKGLVWVGVSWLIGETCGALLAMLFLFLKSNTMLTQARTILPE